MSRKHVALFALATVAATTLLVAVPAQAQAQGDWLVRARALHLDSANKDSTPLALSVNNKVFPEVDISYFFTPNWAAELVLTYPQKHDIRSGASQIGTLKHLPPTFSLQYHFTGMGFRPYVGAGLNLTRFSSVKFDPAVQAALQPTIKKTSVGFAYGAGFDVPMANDWVFNVDVKKVQIGTDVKSKGTKVGEFKVDPVLFSIGIGKKF